MGCANSCSKNLQTAQKAGKLYLESADDTGCAELDKHDLYVERLTDQKKIWEELITNQKYPHIHGCSENQNVPFGDEGKNLDQSEVSTSNQRLKNLSASSFKNPSPNASSMIKRIDPNNLCWALKYARISPDDKFQQNGNRIIKGCTSTLLQCIPLSVEVRKVQRRNSRSNSLSSRSLVSPRRESKLNSMDKRSVFRSSSSYSTTTPHQEEKSFSGKGGSDSTDLQGGRLSAVLGTTAHGEVCLNWILVRLLETTSVSADTETWENVVMNVHKIAQDAGLPLPFPCQRKKCVKASSEPFVSPKRSQSDTLSGSFVRMRKRRSYSYTSAETAPLPQTLFLGAMKVWRFGKGLKGSENKNSLERNQRDSHEVFLRCIEKCHHLVRRWRYLSAKCEGVLKCFGSEYFPEECKTVTPLKESDSESHCFRVYMECCRFGTLQEYKEKDMKELYGYDRVHELTARALMREVLLTLHQLHEENELQYEITTRSILLQFPFTVPYLSAFPQCLDCKALDAKFKTRERTLECIRGLEVNPKGWRIPTRVQRILVPYCFSEKSSPSRSPCNLLSVDVPINPLSFSKVPPLVGEKGDSSFQQPSSPVNSYSTKKKCGAHECSVLPPPIKTSGISNSPYGGVNIQVDHKFSGPFVGYSRCPMPLVKNDKDSRRLINQDLLKGSKREIRIIKRRNSLPCVTDTSCKMSLGGSATFVGDRKYVDAADITTRRGSCSGSKSGFKRHRLLLEFSRNNAESLEECKWLENRCTEFETGVPSRSQSLLCRNPVSATRTPMNESNVPDSCVDLLKDQIWRNQEKLEVETSIYMKQDNMPPRCSIVSESHDLASQSSYSKKNAEDTDLRPYSASSCINLSTKGATESPLPFFSNNLMSIQSLPLPMFLESGSYKWAVSDSFSCTARPRYCTRLIHSAALRRELQKASLVFNGGEITCSNACSPNSPESIKEGSPPSFPISRDSSAQTAANSSKNMSIGTEHFVTPDHLAPEVLRGGECSEASDIYAWAMTFIDLTSNGVSSFPFTTPNEVSTVIDSTKDTKACAKAEEQGCSEKTVKEGDPSIIFSNRVLKSLGISFTSLPACLPTHCHIPSVFVEDSVTSSVPAFTPSDITPEIQSVFLKEWADNLRQYYDEQEAKERILREEWENANPSLFPRSFAERSHLKLTELLENVGEGWIGYPPSPIRRSSLPSGCRVIIVRRLTHTGMVNLFPAPVHIPDHLSLGCRAMLQWCLQLDASSRPSASELLNTYYFQNELGEEETFGIPGDSSLPAFAAEGEDTTISYTENLKASVWSVGREEEDRPLKPEKKWKLL